MMLRFFVLALFLFGLSSCGPFGYNNYIKLGAPSVDRDVNITFGQSKEFTYGERVITSTANGGVAGYQFSVNWAEPAERVTTTALTGSTPGYKFDLNFHVE